MGYATLGFPGGLGMRFRIDPQAMNWNFKVHTSVTPTVGGRVVQVMGATLSDLQIVGQFGEDHSQAAHGNELEHPGRSWRLAVRFAQRIRQLMEQQTIDANDQGKMHQTAVFSYPPGGWKFNVYIKAFNDPDGGAISIRTSKFSHSYVLTLFIVQDGSDQLIQAGSANGVLNKAKAAAINQYIGRISEGIGWTPSVFNGDFGKYYDGMFDAQRGRSAAQHASDSIPNNPSPFTLGSGG